MPHVGDQLTVIAPEIGKVAVDIEVEFGIEAPAGDPVDVAAVPGQSEAAFQRDAAARLVVRDESGSLVVMERLRALPGMRPVIEWS